MSEESPTPGAVGAWETLGQTGFRGDPASSLQAASAKVGFPVPAFTDLGVPDAVETTGLGGVRILWRTTPIGAVLVIVSNGAGSPGRDPSVYANPEATAAARIAAYRAQPGDNGSGAVAHSPRRLAPVALHSNSKIISAEGYLTNHFDYTILGDPGTKLTALLPLVDDIAESLATA